jgi:D-glycero-alpha-D-manno-heptose-7-phosphate kinase
MTVIDYQTRRGPKTGGHRYAVTRARAQRAQSEKPRYRARAPLRISFAGGGTDVPPFPEREGGLVLSATINRYAHGMLRPRSDDRIRVESLDLDTALEYGAHEHPEMDGNLDLVKAAIDRVARQLGEPHGVDVFLRSSAPPGSGLGGSSALIVTLLGLLRDFHKLALSDYETAHLAWELERVDLGLKGGLQDQYATAFGGFNFIEFTGEGVLVNPLRIHADTMLELEENLVLCFTGQTRAGDQIIEDQTKRFTSSNEAALAGLRSQKELVLAMKDVLLRGKLGDFGDLLDTSWQSKKKLSPKIATPLIDEAYQEARRCGALGGKVTGAGGGGYMIFYCAPGKRHKVSSRLAQLGLSEAEFAFEQNGLTTWTNVES